MPPIGKLVDLLLSLIHAVNWRTEEARNEALRLWEELGAHAEDQIEADEPRTPTPVLAELTEKIASLGEKNMDLQRELDAARAELGRVRMDNDAVHRDLAELRDQWRTLATLVEPLGILDAEGLDPATLTEVICRWISDLRADSAYQARVLGERQQEIDRLRTELEMAERDRED